MERVSHACTITLHGRGERVFSCFEPEGERRWAPEWDPQWVAPSSGEAEAGAVFRVGDAVWVIAEHEPAGGRIAYVVFYPGSRVTRIEITLRPCGDDATEATVRYTHTPLSQAGAAHVAGLDQAHHDTSIREWQEAINRLLAAGRPAADGGRPATSG